MATPLRALPTMAGSDLASSIDDTYDGAMDILDTAAFHIEDVFANRPTASSAKLGTFFIPTDLPGFLYLSDGTNWIEVAPGMGAVPIGASMEWWSANDPGDTRFVKMDGRALSTTAYAALFALIGNTYDTQHGAAAPGAGLFRIPNTAGHVIVGAGTAPKAGISTRTLGSAGGAESVTLAVSQMPSHAHSVYDPSHAHSIYDPGHGHSISGGVPIYNTSYGANGVPTAANGSVWSFPRQALGADARGTGIGIYGAYTGISIYANGGGGAHENMPPWVAANRIMRIA